jgi:hypothetical protein
VLRSTGFRVDRRPGVRVFRRADVELDTVLDALEREGLDEAHGGPPPGPAADPFARGQGAAEPGAPARGTILVDTLPGGFPRSAGMRAWRAAHAAMLRGFQTQAPLALVEELRLGVARRSWLLRRGEPLDPLLGPGDEIDRREAFGVAARTLGAMHAAGLHGVDPHALQVRPIAPDSVVLGGLERLRVRDRVPDAARAADLSRLADSADGIARPERARLLAPYRESGDAADAAWSRVFPDASRAR